jgi:hypothetical protein
MSDKRHHGLEEHKKFTTLGSGIALGATGVAAFTTAAPVLTGVFVGAALISSGVAAYNYYKALGEEKETDKSAISKV